MLGRNNLYQLLIKATSTRHPHTCSMVDTHFTTLSSPLPDTSINHSSISTTSFIRMAQSFTIR